MPFYEYQCSACEHRFEALQKISDAALQECPKCGQNALNKLISAAGFRLKGGGWYETDFKNNTKKADAKSPSSDTAAKPAGDSKSAA